MDADERLSARFAHEADGLRRVARGVLLEPALADDAVQEAWLAALKLRAPVSGAWLVESVRRIALGLRRTEARVHRRERAAARGEAQPAADETAERVDALRQVVEALDELAEPYRSAVRLRYLDDLPLVEVARRLGLPQETARTHLRRGLERMRARLDANNAKRREAFLSAFAPLALGVDSVHVGALATTARHLGGAVLSTQTKLIAAAVLTCVIAFLGWRMANEPDAASRSPEDGAKPAIAVESSSPSSGSANSSVAESSPTASARATVASAVEARSAWIARGEARLGSAGPFAGAQLRVRAIAGYEGDGEVLLDEALRADSSGRFEFSLEPPAGAVRIQLTSDDRSCIAFAPAALVPTGAPPPQDLSVRLYPLDFRVTGRVVDASGQPLAAARVGAFSYSVAVDEQGRFELFIPTLFRDPRLEAWCAGYALRSTILHTAGHEQLADVEIRLDRCSPLRGRVVDEFGAPVENARVRAGFSRRSTALTDARGEFALDHLDDDEEMWVVFVENEGFTSKQHQIDGPEERAKPLILTLERGLDLEGRVVDENGAPLRGATVYAGFSPHADPRVNAVSHDDGSFLLRNVSRNEVRVGAELAGFAPHSHEVHLPARGPLGAALELVLERGVTLRGRVEDSNGAPVEAATLHLMVDGEFGANLSAKSDEHGRFEIASVPAQAHLELSISASGFLYGHHRVDVVESEQRIVLERAAGIAGRVIDAATGEPVRRFRVRFVTPQLESGERALYGYTANWGIDGVLFDDERGEWNTDAEALPVGCVVGIEIRAPGYGPLVLPRVTSRFDPAPDDVVAELGPGCSVRGLVVDRTSGAPVAGARVRVVSDRDRERGRRAEGSGSAAATTDALGRFEFDSLPRETIWLSVEAERFALAVDGPLEMPAAGDPAPRAISLTQGGAITGQLLGADGAPRAKQVVVITRLVAEPSFSRDVELVTDANGSFRAEGLAPGEHQLSVALEHDYGTVFDLSRTIQVSDGVEIEVELRPGGVAALRGVLTSTSTMPDEVPITLRRMSGEGECSSLWRCAIAREGRFEIDGLEPGVWSVLASLQLPTADRKVLVGSTQVAVEASGESACTIALELVR